VPILWTIDNKKQRHRFRNPEKSRVLQIELNTQFSHILEESLKALALAVNNVFTVAFCSKLHLLERTPG
jgi:hypothetical protein